MAINTEDKRIGMGAPITRRDFIEGSLQFAGSLALAGAGAPMAAEQKSCVGMARSATSVSHYPPSRSGLRGSHDGAFEVAHQMAWEGRTDWGRIDAQDNTDYDLVVVGAGISGLAAAYFFLEKNPDARILIMDNHDDFGGHAKRNEFSWGDRTILGYGGSQSLEAPSAYSDTAKSLLKKLNVDLNQLSDAYDQEFYRRNDLGSVVHFDRETYGSDVTLRSQFVDGSLFMPLAESTVSAIDAVAQMPLSGLAKEQLRRLLTSDKDTLPDQSIFAEPGFLGSVSYEDFLTRHAGITEPEVLNLFHGLGSSYFGHGTDMIPAIFALGFGMPGLKGTSLGTFKGIIEKAIRWSTEPYTYHFPDGNASVARLLVRSLIPGVASGKSMNDVVTATFDYNKLDSPDAGVRLRLGSTVVNVTHKGSPKSATQVDVTYVRDGSAYRVRAKQVVLACYNMAIPHICPALPAAQKEALAKLVKLPMSSLNVMLRNQHAIRELGMGMAYSPGRWNKTLLVDFPVSMGEYQFGAQADDPVMLHGLKGVMGEGDTPEAQSRTGRYKLLGIAFEDYEREIRQHLAGMFASTDFDPARDIAAITMNRWPHGYAWNSNPLFDPAYEEGEAPNELGRKPFGRITIANSDAGARAYLDCAIDEAWRAVSEIE